MAGTERVTFQWRTWNQPGNQGQHHHAALGGHPGRAPSVGQTGTSAPSHYKENLKEIHLEEEPTNIRQHSCQLPGQGENREDHAIAMGQKRLRR